MALTRKFLRAGVSTAMLIAATSTASVQQANAEGQAKIYDAQIIAEVGGAERINYSGKLRMLSQRIPAAACNLHAGISADQSKEILTAATAEFEQIVYALEHGDPALGIVGPEPRRKTLAALEALKTEWEPIDAALHLMLDEGTSTSLIKQLADHNAELLDAAKLLASELSGQYSDPAALVQADAIRIDIAGRQRMLSQRMSKDFCLAASDIYKEGSLEDLKKITSMFDLSLDALRNGMPAAGIKASDDPDITAALDVVAADWELVKTDFQVLKTGGLSSIDVREAVFEHLNTLLVDMNKAVMMYSQVSKQNT